MLHRMAKRPQWIYTVEIRYRCGARHLRRMTSASDKTAMRHIVQRHVERDKELMSILITDKWPRAKKARQQFLEERKRAKEEAKQRELQALADYEDDS